MAKPTFEAISLGPPADGWRAVYSTDNRIGIEPLVCWGVFRKKTPASPTKPSSRASVPTVRRAARSVSWSLRQQRPISRATSRRITPDPPLAQATQRTAAI
jgi:hypothetical protein